MKIRDPRTRHGPQKIGKSRTSLDRAVRGPNSPLIPDEDNIAWDWEQQFSQLAAEFITTKDSI